ncbi:hypothetical protein FOZ61_005973 [Perkinsus olseni]|uniref:Uncharacterized protein n=1 Tax=Perkinsus olseni TaxID=32597 RepID=A0A7J6LFI2_PEROL|nr:hypothetical protein FOZ61_005973 [Perkinsus olseni]
MGDAVARALSKQQKTLKRMGFDPARPGDGVIRNKLGMPVMEKGMRVAFPGIRLFNPILNTTNAKWEQDGIEVVLGDLSRLVGVQG